MIGDCSHSVYQSFRSGRVRLGRSHREGACSWRESDFVDLRLGATFRPGAVLRPFDIGVDGDASHVGLGIEIHDRRRFAFFRPCIGRAVKADQLLPAAIAGANEESERVVLPLFLRRIVPLLGGQVRRPLIAPGVDDEKAVGRRILRCHARRARKVVDPLG